MAGLFRLGLRHVFCLLRDVVFVKFSNSNARMSPYVFQQKKVAPEEIHDDGEIDIELIPPAAIECAGSTHVGKQRTINQDQFLVADLHKNMHVKISSDASMSEQLFGETLGKLLLVADGIGGNKAGEVASLMAMQTMAQFLLNSMHWLFNPRQPEIEQFVEDLKAGAMHSHAAVRHLAEDDPRQHGMGTTLTAAYLMWPMLYVLHVGDSRCYVLRGGSLELLTKDQTLAQHLCDCGHLNGTEFEESPYHHVLLSSIGAKENPEAIVYKTRLLTGDRILVCSDGVNAHVEDSEIEQILSLDQSPGETCQQLIDLANERGGRDNITAVVAFTHA